MGYVGNTPALNYTTFAVQHFTTSATTSYTLDNAVTNENGIALFINNVRQEPGSSYAYTATGTALTLSAATTTSDTMYCVFIGKAVQTVNPGAGSVGTSQLATDAVTTVKITDTNVTGAKLNDDAISGQGALGAAPADTDEFLVSDAGVLKRVDYSYIKGITQTSFLPTANPLIINGNMAVAQRSTSVAAVASGTNTLDRWGLNKQGSPGTWTQTKESLSAADQATTGQKTALKMDCTAANSSLDATDYLAISYSFEGQDLQVFKKGTTAAETMTIAFWVKSTKTGTYCIFLYDEDNNRMMSNSYTVDTTDTWEQKIFAVPADTTGAFGDDNGNSFQIYFITIAGSNFTSGSLATAWATYSQVNEAPGQVNAGDSTSNNFHLTGVQLEVGTYTSADLPPFRFESHGDNLRRCWRYFRAMLPADNLQANVRMGVGNAISTTVAQVNHILPVRMRTTPSLVKSADDTDMYLYQATGGSPGQTAMALTGNDSSSLVGTQHTVASGLTSTGACQILAGNTDARLSFNADF